jgi:hypothetical protein
LTIVFAGSGEAQANPKESNVNVINTPLPVTGSVAATVSGNISATIVNPANNPVLIRNVDAQGVKELWQEEADFTINAGLQRGDFVFPVAAPEGKALVIEHMHILYYSFDLGEQLAPNRLLVYSSPFGVSSQIASQDFVPHKVGDHFVADATGKFYVPPGGSVQVVAERGVGSPLDRIAFMALRLTGYLVNYP